MNPVLVQRHGRPLPGALGWATVLAFVAVWTSRGHEPLSHVANRHQRIFIGAAGYLSLHWMRKRWFLPFDALHRLSTSIDRRLAAKLGS